MSVAGFWDTSVLLIGKSAVFVVEARPCYDFSSALWENGVGDRFFRGVKQSGPIE